MMLSESVGFVGGRERSGHPELGGFGVDHRRERDADRREHEHEHVGDDVEKRNDIELPALFSRVESSFGATGGGSCSAALR